MKKFMSLICSAAMASAMLADFTVSAEEYALPEYHTYNELMEISNEKLAELYAEDFPEYFTDNGEYKSSDKTDLELIAETLPREEYAVRFYDILDHQADGILRYRVDTQYDLDFEVKPSAFGLPDEWEIVYDAGYIDGRHYYLGNFYRVKVPFETATDFDSYVRIGIAQKLWSMYGKTDVQNVEYGTELFQPIWVAGAPKLLGDMNADGVNVTDAVSVMCHVTNPEKYPLDIYQKRAADVYQNGDGLNSMDVLTIQKYVAGMVQTLPETYLDLEVNYDLSEYNYEPHTFEELLAMDLDEFLAHDAYCGDSPETLTKEQEYRCMGEVMMQRGRKIPYSGELPEDFHDIEGVSQYSIGLIPIGEDTYYIMERLVPTFYLDKADTYANGLYTTTGDVEKALAEMIGDDISYTVKLKDIEKYWITVEFDLPSFDEITAETMQYYASLYYIMTSINPGFECY